MPIKKSAIKALRQSKRHELHNKKIKSDVTALIRHVRKSIGVADHEQAVTWLKQAIKQLDKATQKGILKKNTAARRKSRLSKAVSALKTVAKKK